MSSTVKSIAPIRRAIDVSWSQAEAYERFTARFAAWWPRYALSIGGSRIRTIVFESRVGGLIYEEHKDGSRFLWGKVEALEPPRSVAFTWHPTRTADDAQHVTVTFTPRGSGTRVELVSTGWERMSAKAQAARGGYEKGWGGCLAAYAGRFSGMLMLFNTMSAGIDLVGQRGRFVRESLGRMER